MKCPKCGGTGEMQICEMGFIGKDECDKCHGKGYLNNEEWLRKANKEEMEHTLTMLIMKDRFFADKEFAYVNIRFGVHCWLKEKHGESE